MKNINNKKIILIISIILIVLIIALIVILNVSKNRKNEEKLIEQVKTYTSIKDFKTIEEVAAYLECEFKKQEKSKNNNYDIDVYMQIKYKPYTDNESNEGFYNKLVLYSASAVQYQNFRIIDLKNDITIEVLCDKENKKAKSIAINGESNYFAKHNSYSEIKKIEDTKITNMEIQSDILKNLINNNWKVYGVNFGTKESTFEKYDIYFDEGIKVKPLSGKVFNIIFTEKYNKSIASNIKTTTSKEDIIKKLGKPTFVDESSEVIGYKGNDIYLFYNSKKEISVYRVVNDFDSKEFSKIVDTYLENKDESQIIKDVKNKYPEYDKYENNEIGTYLQYTLNGFAIKFIKGTSKGIQIYNNYIGTIYKDIDLKNIIENTFLPDNIFVNNEDLVAKNEIDRVYSKNNIINNMKSNFSNNEEPTKSNKFYLIKEKLDLNLYKIKFISINGENPDSELRENVDYYMWIDDYNFIYSLRNKGIYIYNLNSGKYGKIVEGKEEFKLIEYKDNILKYDEKSIVLKK